MAGTRSCWYVVMARSKASLTELIENANWRDGELIATVSEVVRIYDTARLGWLRPIEDQ